MNNCLKHIAIASMVFFVAPSWSDPVIEKVDHYWQCSARDSAENQWLIKDTYQRVASSKAFDACKKQSNAPMTCRSPRNHCEYFVNGITTRPMWRCTALDWDALPWKGNVNSSQDDAALDAKDYCKEGSRLPDTCYINLLTCKNLNGNS